MKTHVNDLDMRREGYIEGVSTGISQGRAEGEKDTYRFLINKWLQKGKNDS